MKSSILIFVSMALLLFSVSGVSMASGAKLELAKNGKTNYVIATAAQATAVDKYAAETLAKYLKQMTKANFKLVKASKVGKWQPCIYVGTGDTKPLKAQEFVVKNDGKNIYLYGEGKHGALNAVVDFLENELGWRWYTPLEDPVVPSKPTLVLNSFNRTRGFSFAYRQLPYWYNQEYYYLLGGNMGWQMGGRKLAPFVVSELPCTKFTHTTLSYIPPLPNNRYAKGFKWQDKKDYFKTNPDFFTLNAQGKRVSNKQLCFSNPKLRAELTKNVIRDIDYTRRTSSKDWGKMYVTMTPADTGGHFCHCDGCMALEKKYQSQGGPIFDYAIELCETLQKERPGVMVKISAYRRSQTQKPPVLTDRKKLPENMMVSFAPIEDVYFADWLNHKDEKVQETYSDLVAWGKITDHLWAWIYPSPYGTGIEMPVALIDRITNNFRMMKKAGVEFIFTDHPTLHSRSNFSELQRYLMLKLMKDINCDAAAVIKEFTDYHYGKAAPLMRKYIDELEQCRINMKLPAGVGKTARPVTYKSHDYSKETFPYLTAENINRWQKYFDEMERLTAKEPGPLLRVQAERRELDLATLLRWKSLKAKFPETYKDYKRYSARVRATNAKLKKEKTPVVWTLGESAIEEFEFRIKIVDRDIPLPESLKGIAPEKVRQFLPRQYARNHPKFIKEPGAPMGYATPVHRPDNPLMARFYDRTNQRAGAMIGVGLDEIIPGKYRLYELGEIVVTPVCQIEFSGKSCATQLRLGERLYEPGAENKWKAYVELKFDGPTYGGKAKKDEVLVGRIILVSMSKDQFSK